MQRFMRNTPPDLVLVVLNASQISSQLRLLLQMRQLGLPVVAALNMWDEARQFGIGIDHRGLSEALGMPVLPVSAKLNEGIAELIDQLHQCGEATPPVSAKKSARSDPSTWGPNRQPCNRLMTPLCGKPSASG